MNIKISDETDLKQVIVCKQRSYEVPKDVANSYDLLVAALRAVQRLDYLREHNALAEQVDKALSES